MTRTSQRIARRTGGKKVSRRKQPDLPHIDFATLSQDQLEGMAEAGCEVLECHRVLAKGGSNVVAEVLPRQDTFYEFDHCPAGDVHDGESHSQYYYHAHRSGEHGHFHTFLREAGMPPGVQPVEQSEIKVMKQRDDKLSHLVAISMDKRGFPIGLLRPTGGSPPRTGTPQTTWLPCSTALSSIMPGPPGRRTDGSPLCYSCSVRR